MAEHRASVPPWPALARLDEMDRLSLEGGGAARVAKQHEAGKLTARERVDLLVDPGSFREYDAFVQHRCTDFGMQSEKAHTPLPLSLSCFGLFATDAVVADVAER